MHLTGFLAIVASLAQAGTEDEPARAAIQKLAGRFKDARTISARIVQIRRTELLDKPITSSGMMYYRRDPVRLVFQLTDPRKAEIHMDRTSYQVYRPDEKRLERIDFENNDITSRLLMMFEPKTDEIGKVFTIQKGELRDGRMDVHLEPTDEKARRHLKKLTLTLVEADGMLDRIVCTDGEGDEVRFDLSDVKLNPPLSSDLFQLKVPEGTRLLRHALKREK